MGMRPVYILVALFWIVSLVGGLLL